jgi:hypothetical protein
MRTDTRQRKHARAGLRALSGEQQRLGVLTRVLHSGKQALGALSLGSNQALALTILLVLWVPLFPLLVRLAARR